MILWITYFEQKKTPANSILEFQNMLKENTLFFSFFSFEYFF